MAKAIKYSNYIDSSGVVHNKRKLSNILSYPINSFSATAISATTGVTSEKTILNNTITETGVYIIWANIPLNYYGQSGRELYLRLKINDIERWYSFGVCNTYIFTLFTQLFTVQNISANSNIKITVQDPSGKTYAVNSFTLYYMKLS